MWHLMRPHVVLPGARIVWAPHMYLHYVACK